MRQKIILLFAALLFLTGLIIWNFFTQTPARLISPWVNKGKEATNLWFPQPSENTGPQVKLEITAKAAYFIDINSGAVLYQKNIRGKMPIASLAKIMSAIVTLENKDWQDYIDVSSQAAAMEPDHMLLRSGEKLTVEELMYGMFLVSANDASEALAENVFDSREEFIWQMNIKAQQLGMKDTLFINPSGLQEEDREQYSTAFDVVLMSRYAVKQFPHLVDISSTPQITLPPTSTHQDYQLTSGINLLTTYPGVMGLKTGYTPEAGLTLVTLAQKENHQVLGVLLNSENRREEARELLDYSFQKLGVK